MSKLHNTVIKSGIIALMLAMIAGCMTMRTAAVSVAEAQAAPDGTYVVIDVRIAQELDDERFLVRDATGEIIANIDESIMGEVQVAPDASLRLYGEIDRDETESVLNVEKIKVID